VTFSRQHVSPFLLLLLLLQLAFSAAAGFFKSCC